MREESVYIMEVRVSDRGTLTVLNVPHREGRCRYLIRKEEDRFWAKVVRDNGIQMKMILFNKKKREKREREGEREIERHRETEWERC